MVQPLTPPVVAPASATGSWYEPTPTTAPPRDPPRWWSVAADPPTEHKRIRYELVAMLVLIAAPSFFIGLDGITDPTSIDISDISVLELLASLAGSVGVAAHGHPVAVARQRLAAAGYNKRSPLFTLGYGALGFLCCYGAIIVVGLGRRGLRRRPRGGEPTAARTRRRPHAGPPLTVAYIDLHHRRHHRGDRLPGLCHHPARAARVEAGRRSSCRPWSSPPCTCTRG